MSEMIERVAEAMKNRRRELIHAPLDRVWDDLARAAIEAMREPTEAMLNAGPPEPYMDRDVWAEMVNATLSNFSPALDKALQDELDHPPASIVKED